MDPPLEFYRETIWQKAYGTEADDSLYHAILLNGGGYLMLGRTDSIGADALWALMVSEQGHVLSTYWKAGDSSYPVTVFRRRLPGQ